MMPRIPIPDMTPLFPNVVSPPSELSLSPQKVTWLAARYAYHILRSLRVAMSGKGVLFIGENVFYLLAASRRYLAYL